MNNYQKGRNFELKAKAYFENLYGVEFKSGKILTGLNGGKPRQFDLINEENKILIECKKIKINETGNLPSAKISDFLKEIYKLHLAPNDYKKIMCIAYAYSDTKKITLKEYIVNQYFDFIPDTIEIVELK